MARTTLVIDDDLFRMLKLRAAQQGATLREFVSALLRRALLPTKARIRYQLRWTTERGKVLPGVNLDDRDALFNLMEGR
ncbi:MAG: DUF2191 domain-containing protein [Deltaproteobacteria bacterium]|nr:DUF2191 domain-containing protein [Deltaproteobacteria bacterium]